MKKLLFLIIALFGATHAALAKPQIPGSVLPTIKCIYSVLKSSNAVQSVDLYSIDRFRFGIEYVFKNKERQPVVSYVEIVFVPDNSPFLGDKIPNEVTEQTMVEGEEILSSLNLDTKCHLREAFDNLLPQPAPLTAWRRIDLPTDFP